MANIFGFTPESGLISKLGNLVTIDTAQTITGEKTFDSDIICTQDITTENLVFGDGTIQTTAYTGGAPGNFVTTNTAQTITAEKTFSAPIEFSSTGNVRFNAPVQFSYGGDISANYTFPPLGPIATLYSLSPTVNIQINVPAPSAALAGSRVFFKRIGGTSGTNVTFRVSGDPTRVCFLNFNLVTPASSASISTQFQGELVYLTDLILLTNVT